MNSLSSSLMISQLYALAETDAHAMPLLSNASALLNESLNDINWVGFYLLKDGRLVLGPFQGKTACIHIPIGNGVCGTAAAQKKTLRIANVHEFEGHIACDSASNSEIVIPLCKDGNVIGVLDIDSPLYSRFSESDETELTAFAHALEELLIL